MKKNFLDIVSFIRKDPFNLGVFIISILIFICLGIAFNFKLSFLLFILINLLWICPYIKRRIKAKKRNMKFEGSKKVKTNKKTKKKKILLGILIFFLVCVVLGIVFIVYIALTVEKFDPGKLYSKEASTLYDSDGNVFAKLGTEMREKISYDEMSEELINAIVATEDSRFFEHNGFDLPRFVKASVGQVLGQNAGGASTLTMQVSKNQLTSTVKNGFEGLKRKFSDIYLSIFQIEKNYTKEEILEFYANSYYLGSGAYGVEQAAEVYFQKDAKDLNLSEAAMLAGMFQSPYSYDPNLYPEKTEKRRLTVLYLMKRHGYITESEYNIAKEMTVDKIVIKGRSARTNYSQYQGFVDTVALEVQKKTGYDPYSYSMKIYTTMDKKKQDAVTDIMNGKSYTWENDKVEAGIVAVEAKTGAIVAIGSGRNVTGAKELNNATQIKKQIGSTAKPLYDYGPAIEYNNWTTEHPIIDSEYTYSDGTKINNWDGGYKGFITARQALADSRNIPALKTFQSVENEKIKTFTQNLGLSPEMSSSGKLFESNSIGGYTGESPLTVAAAYNAFASEGTYIEPHSFTKVVFDKSGKTYENEYKKNKVMSAETAYMVTSMLIDTGKSALGRYSNINGATFAAKTGTSNYDEKTKSYYHYPNNAVNDLWVAGYNAEYSIAVWYGYEKNSSEHYNKFGSSQNSKLFQAVAKNFFKSDVNFTKPSGIVEVTVEKYSNSLLLPSENTPDDMKTVEMFKSDSKPTEVSARFNALSNVTDLKVSVTGNSASLSWKGIGTPDALNADYWKTYIEKGFSNDNDKSTYLSYVMNINSQRLGSVVYNVYEKNGDNLKLLTTVSETSATVKISKSTTLVVKASYSNYGGCDSSGTSVKADYKGSTASDVDASINGEDTIEVALGKSYTEPAKPVKVLLNDEDITTSSDVKIVLNVLDESGNLVTDYQSVIGTVAGVYTFNYKVSYKGTAVDTLVKTITVK